MNLIVKAMGCFDVVGGAVILLNTSMLFFQIIAWILIIKGVVSLLS